MKCRPSGRNDGKTCWISPRDGSSVVRGDADPPFAETRVMPPGDCPKMITPSWFHEPPTATPDKSQRVSAFPPKIPIFLSLLPASNAMYRLSGDQEKGGSFVDSEPAMGRASSESMERTQMRNTPSGPTAKNAT